jgi:hypothetical protein
MGLSLNTLLVFGTISMRMFWFIVAAKKTSQPGVIERFKKNI